MKEAIRVGDVCRKSRIVGHRVNHTELNCSTRRALPSNRP